MKYISFIAALSVTGCQTDKQVATVDTAIAELLDNLNGTEPSTVLALPTFTATNHDGQTRNQNNLIGNPTVLWFFPFAGTPV